VGAANGRNPDLDRGALPPGGRSTGELTGYAGGVDAKAALLALERGGTLF
jgi:hypothetical protein